MFMDHTRSMPVRMETTIEASEKECRTVWGRHFRHLIASAVEIPNPGCTTEKRFRITFKSPTDTGRCRSFAGRCQMSEYYKRQTVKN